MTSRITIKRALTGTLLAIMLAAAIVIGWQLADSPDPARTSAPPANDAALIQRGGYLARAGNCIACHTARGGEPYAGGRAIATPFGDIYASNITPDKATGIGDWTADDFWRALHHGRSRDGSFLYPAFPYPNYTKVTRADSDALYAYLRTLPAISQPNKAHQLRFPYNQRILLAFWRAMYFKPGEFRTDSQQSAEWNRGAYLVQGLGHCSACHTSRNALGGTISDRDLAGGLIPMLNWHASSLTSGTDSGLGTWDINDMTTLLKSGVSMRGAVFGPMAEVVNKSLQHLSDDDIRAMAVYLKSMPDTQPDTQPDTPPQPAAKAGAAINVTPETEAMLKLGAQRYEDHCASCHGSDGKGKPPAYPPLAAAPAASAPVNAIRIVLNGGYPPSTAGNPRPHGMPPFGYLLSDEEVAAVVSFIRTRWGNQGSLVSPNDVARLRGGALD